jgi:hypothetical protein
LLDTRNFNILRKSFFNPKILRQRLSKSLLADTEFRTIRMQANSHCVPDITQMRDVTCVLLTSSVPHLLPRFIITLIHDYSNAITMLFHFLVTGCVNTKCLVGMSQPARSAGMNMWTRTQKPHCYSIFGHSQTIQGTKFTTQFRSTSLQ